MFSVGLQSNYCGIDPYIVQLPLRNATPITVVKSLFTTGREDYRILTLQRAGRRKISVCHCPICHNFPMCGRYRLSRRKQTVEEHFDTASGEEDWSPRYNIAPTQPVAVIRQNPKEPVRELSLMRWGLIPSWAKDSSSAARMINARSETASTKPVFRDAFKFRRCLIPADEFYEWMRTGKAKQPFCFEVNDGQLFAFAGIWDRWKNPSPLYS
jgi:hypothetical protein